jgi:SnoaL-like domain
MTNTETVRSYYSGFEKREWNTVEKLLGDGFTFTSPNGDDRIDMRGFKAKCWLQSAWVERFELESVIEEGSEIFVKYLCHTNYGRSFRNTEYFRLANGKIEAIECYFGGSQGYPSQYAPDLHPGSASVELAR